MSTDRTSSGANTEPPSTVDETDPTTTTDRGELEAQIELLAEENRQLRDRYVRTQQARYRRTALALVAVGVLALGGGVVFPDSRTILFALGGTGVFAGILTRYLTPERFVAASVGERVYTAVADTGTALTSELGLQSERIYVPLDETAGSTDSPARLFIPQQTSFDLPAPADLDTIFVVSGDDSRRGVALPPTGGPLFREFERALSEGLQSAPRPLAEQLVDGLREQFELVESTTLELDGENEQAVVGIAGSAYGSVDRFDHPITSFLGVGFAVGLDRPVTVGTRTVDDDRADVLVTCSWSPLDG